MNLSHVQQLPSEVQAHVVGPDLLDELEGGFGSSTGLVHRGRKQTQGHLNSSRLFEHSDFQIASSVARLKHRTLRAACRNAKFVPQAQTRAHTAPQAPD